MFFLKLYSICQLRKIIILVAIIILSLGISQLLGLHYQQVNKDGFGNPANNLNIIRSMLHFNDYLYAGTSGMVAELWRSKDGFIWEQVIEDGYGNANNKSICNLLTYSNYVYIGTYNEVEGAEILRSLDGIAWIKVSSNGFGNSNNNPIWDMEVFNGYLYASTKNRTSGGEIWRSSNGINWQPVSQATNGFGNSYNKAITELKEFKGALYAGTYNYTEGCEIWRSSDGISWQPVAQAINGFGNKENEFFTFGVIDGYLYAGTSCQFGTNGCELWRSLDGINWVKANQNGFGNKDNESIGSIKLFKGEIYVGVGNYVNGVELWKSSNGTFWIKDNTNGFGDTNNHGVGAMAVFNNKLFLGTFNNHTGCEVWQGCEVVSCSLNLLKNTDSPAGNVVPNQNNITCLSFNISDSILHKIKHIRISKEGTAQPGTDIQAVKLWKDINGNYAWDADDIQINSSGTWDAFTRTWNFTNISLSQGQNLIVTVDISGSAVNARTFRAKIGPGDIVCQTNNINGTGITNDNAITIAAGKTFKIPYFDNMESPANYWLTEMYGGSVYDLWHRTTQNYFSPNTSWWCGMEATGDYGTLWGVNTALVSPSIDLSYVTIATLKFKENYNTEGWPDRCMIDISTNNGLSWIKLRSNGVWGSSGGWISNAYSLNAFAGKEIRIRFYFYTGNNNFQEYPGWFVDDVSITSPTNLKYLFLRKNVDVPATMVEQGDTNICIMAFKVSNICQNDIDIIKIANSGSMDQSIDIGSIELWNDVNENNQWDGNDIKISTNAFWNASEGKWVFSGLSVPATNFILTIDIKPGAIKGRTFQAVIDYSNVVTMNGIYNLNSMENANKITIIEIPDNPFGLIAETISIEQINLIWYDITNETSFTLYRSLSNDTNTATNIAGRMENVTNYSNIGLKPDTIYYYWIKAFNAWISSGFSEAASNITMPIPPRLKADAISKDQIDLWWNDLKNEITYKLFRSEINDAKGAQKIANLSGNQTNYSDMGLKPETTYYYWIKAINRGGESDYSKAVFATTKQIFPPVWAVFPTYFNLNQHEKATIYFAGETLDVDVYIYDAAGNLVKKLDNLKEEKYINWYGKDDDDEQVNAGIYIIYIKGNNFAKKVKMILIR